LESGDQSAVTLLFLLMFVFVGVLLVAFLWTQLRPSQQLARAAAPHLRPESSRPNVDFTPHIRNALGAADFDFLARRGGALLAKRVKSERRMIALSYLGALRHDFEKLLQQAKMIAALSPDVVAKHEFERMWLSLEFSLRCNWIRTRILFGSRPVFQLGGLSDVVSGFAIEIESAMREIAERAAAAADLTSSLNRRGIDSV
jgi:hypothetical protein